MITVLHDRRCARKRAVIVAAASAGLNVLFLLMLLSTACGCGAGAEGGGGYTDLPTSGAGPYGKITEGALSGSESSAIDEPFVILDKSAGSRACAPSPVVRSHGMYTIFFEWGPAGASVIRRAETDLIDLPSNDLEVLSSTQPWEEGSVGSPSVLMQDDGQMIMYYEGGLGSIGLARSFDGFVFEPWSGNPVLEPLGQEEGGWVGHPSVVFDDGVYHLYYSAGPNLGIFMARSRDGVEWDRVDALPSTAAADPVVAPSGIPGRFDEAGVQQPFVRISSPAGRAVFGMWFVGQSAESEHAVGFAGSFDGVFFERMPDSVLEPGGVDEIEPAVAPRGSGFVMFFCQESTRQRTGIAAALH